MSDSEQENRTGNFVLCGQMRQIMTVISEQPGAEATIPVLRELTGLESSELHLTLIELTGRGWLTQVKYSGHEPGDPLWLWKMTLAGEQQRSVWQTSEPATPHGRSSSWGRERGRSLLVKDPAQRRLFFGMLLFAVLIGLVQVHNFFVYQSYEQGTCTILDGQVVEKSSRSGTSYAPVFIYIVHTKSGQTAQTNGYDAPTQSSFSQDEAQQLFNSYMPGRSYACWYNPIDPTHAVLRFYGASVGGMIVAYTFTVLISWLILLFFGAPLYAGVFSIVKGRGITHPSGCSLILTYFYCLICLGALSGGAFLIVVIWRSA